MRTLISPLIILTFAIPVHLSGQKASIPAIVIHGGAGTIERGQLTDSLETTIRAALQEALDRAYNLLENGGSALDGVVTAIRILENSPHFNAGKGAVMNEAGRHELDASIMDGLTLNAGAVAGVSILKNPIISARAVMDHSPHVLLAGEGAELFAKAQGLEMVSDDYFTTPRVKASWNAIRSENTRGSLDAEPRKFGTVGAVAIDKNGNIAAGTSTGGMMNKRFGRVGDSPIIGAGTYADNNTCGVSCTGQGEYYIRIGFAKEVSDRMALGKQSLEEAVQATMQKLGNMGGQGGVIAMDKNGKIVMDFNTSGMYRGEKSSQLNQIDIYEKP